MSDRLPRGWVITIDNTDRPIRITAQGYVWTMAGNLPVTIEKECSSADYGKTLQTVISEASRHSMGVYF